MGGVPQRSEQLAALVGLGVPLDPEDPALVGGLDRLDHAIGGTTTDDQTFAELEHGLVVVTARGVDLLPGGTGGERSRLECDRVLGALEAADHLAMGIAAVFPD